MTNITDFIAPDQVVNPDPVQPNFFGNIGNNGHVDQVEQARREVQVEQANGQHNVIRSNVS